MTYALVLCTHLIFNIIFDLIRLNFDTDMYRGTDDGPWQDGIPFDGRDIYQFVLQFNDISQNKWCLEDAKTFVNLGSGQRVRCWPWSNQEVLPYKRSGVDEIPPSPPAHLYEKRGDEIPMQNHFCIGPFGCSANDHEHNYDDLMIHDRIEALDGLLPSINSKDNVKAAVKWMVKGDVVGVDTQGFGKHFPHTSQDLIDEKVTPRQVANDLESVSVMGRLMQSVTFSALPSNLFDGDDEDVKISAQINFKTALKLCFKERVVRSWTSSPDGGDNLSILLKQSVDEVCESQAKKLDEILFSGESGAFLKACPLYGIEPSKYDENEPQMPCACCREKYYQSWSSNDYDPSDENHALMMAVQNVALGLHDAKDMCWQCREVCKDDLMKCSKCEVAGYCSKVCQVFAWRGGHKQKCVELRSQWNLFNQCHEVVWSDARSSPKTFRMQRELKNKARIRFMNDYHR